MKLALFVTKEYIFPESGANDMLFTLLITDEVVTTEMDKPCLDLKFVNDFNLCNPIFGGYLLMNIIIIYWNYLKTVLNVL